MSKGSTDWIVIGRFGRPHGLKGFISVIPFTDPPENLLQYNNWHISQDDAPWQPIVHTDTRMHSRHILTQVKGYPTRESLEALTNANIAVPAQQLPELPAGEFYWHELVGMSVVTVTGRPLGNVTDLMPTGSNDVLIVEGEKRMLIPYLLDDVIINIDPDQRCIEVDWDPEF